MICPVCSADNRPGRKFCGSCGAGLAITCPNCGAPTEPGERFCGECGFALVGAAASPGAGSLAAPAASSPAPVSELRHVSVLFADLVGFTTLAEGRDAEETRELLSRYFELARDVVSRYGGAVEKFIGDAVMAVWGAPVAREDDAERAVRAALEIVSAVPTLGKGIAARAGVLTGEAAVTLGATGQGMVAGDLVNTASRLQSVAEPGAVLVGEATERAANRAIAFERVTDQMLKGKSAAVPAWRALRVVAEVGGKNRAGGGLEAPFVGRDDELRMLKDLFHATNREQRPRLISVIGAAGIGKTRLAWEFLKYVDGLLEPVWWHDGRSPAYGEGISFWALGEMVRARAGLLENDDEATTRAKVHATVEQHVPSEQERQWIEPALLALLGLQSGIPSQELFAAWRTFFERLTLTQPVVMVFEDFHYADPGLIDFVDHLLEWSRNVPITVVTLARQDLLDKRPDWGAGKRNFTSVYLEPLSEPQMRALLEGLVPGLSEAAIRSIVARADGVPLYAVEIVRMLVADGRLEEVSGAYRPVGELTALAVPETLTALIASRLDALPAADRSMVADAAVLGQSFTPQALAAVSGASLTDVEASLRTLVRREILSLEADPRSPERGQYAFVQALIREVAYNTLAKRDRKVRHLAAARYFESLGSDELAGALASHYLAARTNASEGPEADALATQARIALRAAAERASALGSNGQAIAFLDQALTVTTDPVERADILERAGVLAHRTGHYEDSVARLQEALAAQRALADASAVARVLAKLASPWIQTRQLDAAREMLEPIAADFSREESDPGVIEAGAQLTRVYMFKDESRRAIELADRVLEAAEHADLINLVAEVLITRGTVLSNLNRHVEAVGTIRIGEQLARANGLTLTLMRAWNNLAVANDAADPAAGLVVTREGLVLARRLGLRSWIFGFSVSAGFGMLGTAEWDDGVKVFEEALADDPERTDRIALATNLAIFRTLRGEDISTDLKDLEPLLGPSPQTDLKTFLLDTLAYQALAEGRFADAHRHFLAEIGSQGLTGSGYYNAGRAALWDGDIDGMRDDLAKLEQSGSHGAVNHTRRTTMQAGIAAEEGRPGESLALYKAALEQWRSLGQFFELALTAMDMARSLGPGQPDVRAALEEAREILTRARARPLLERLDGVLAAPGAPARSSAREGSSVSVPS